MSEVTPTDIVRFGGFTGGLNREASELSLTAYETPDASNVYFGPRGEVIRRDGYSKHSSSDSTSGKLYMIAPYTASPYQDWFIVSDTDGKLWMYTQSGASIYPASTGSGQITLADPEGVNANWNQVGVAELKTYFWLSDGYSCYVWNGNPASNWIEITDHTLTGDGTEPYSGTPEMPVAYRLVAWFDRLYAVTGGSRIRISKILEPWSWNSSDWIDVNPDDGYKITAIVPFGSGLVVFKSASTYVLSGPGGDPEELQLFPIHRTVGCQAPNTIAVGDNVLIWFDSNNGVMQFDGGSITSIDESIRAHIKDYSSSYERRNTASAFYHDYRYYLMLPWDADSNKHRTFVYDVRTKAWAEWTNWGFTQVARVAETGQLVGVGPNYWNTANVGLYEILDGSLTDNGTSFSWHFETPWLPNPLEALMSDVRVRRIDVYTLGQTQDSEAVTASLKMYADFNESAAVITETVDSESTDIAVISEFDGYNQLVKTMKFRMESSQDEAFTLGGINVQVSLRPTKRSHL